MVWIIIIILLSTADQLIKAVIRTRLSPNEQITVIDGFLYIIQRKNPGAAWSFLAGTNWGIYLLAAFSATISLVLIFLIFRTSNMKLKACLTIICGGSVGNLIDRILEGGVVDYLDFHFWSYVFPTFNLADTLIVCGTILLCLLILLDPSMLSAKSFTKTQPRGIEHGEKSNDHEYTD